MTTHKEFKDMLDNDDIKICKLSKSFRKKSVSWRQFEQWLEAMDEDPNLML